MKFRIKIEEKFNGKKQFSPQVKENFFSQWENIVETEYETIWSSKTIRVLFDLEDKAIELIEKYKNYSKKTNLNKIKDISYKYYEI